jgi:hypothetical protein
MENEEEGDREERETGTGEWDEEDEIEIDDDEPPKSITKKVMGHKKEYYYVETVKSVDELDKFRFKVILTCK